MPSTIEHTIEPVFDKRSRVLVLGSIPSPKSREQGFFYGHPQNRFWRVLAAVFDEPVPHTIADKKDLLLRRGIALWDVVASCEIEGASDASIRNAIPNDLKRITETADIRAVFCTGAKAGELYARLCEKDFGMPATTLPSTSPANAKATLAQLVDAYRKVLAPFAAHDTNPVLDVADVVKLEQAIAQRGTSLAQLMERAGRFLAYKARNLAGKDARFVVLCGNGNNGGDGWVAARDLAEKGRHVTVVCNASPEELCAQPAHNAALEAASALSQAESARILIKPTKEQLDEAFSQADVCIDAILGTGFEGSYVRDPFDAWIAMANEQRAHGMLTVAADVPSGLSAQTGRAATPCIKADATVTMIVSKPGLETPYAFAFCGTVHVAPIAYIDPIFDEQEACACTTHPAKSGQGDETAKSGTTTPVPDKPRQPVEAKRKAVQNNEFLRAEAEDDDGYDPYSDRRPEPEPLFQRDPWN